jgi:hypothetical protein
MRQPIAGLSGKFNLISTLSALSVRVRRPGGTRKALTLQTAPFIRPALAAGAIPPPLFFERRRHSAYLTSAYLLRKRHSLENIRKTHQRRSRG